MKRTIGGITGDDRGRSTINPVLAFGGTDGAVVNDNRNNLGQLVDTPSNMDSL